ncbi:glycosyltransferase [archaeon]|nr:glycosyltransferase [archaeon]
MKISVIIPAYNEEEVISRCLKSILSQDYKDYEVIVVDNGSTDDTKKIVKSFKNKRVRLVEERKRGVSNARNKGAAVAKADVLFFLDADEFLEPHALKNTDKLMKKYDPDTIRYQRRVQRPDSWRRIWVYKYLGGWGVHEGTRWRQSTSCPYIMKRGVLDKIGGFKDRAYYFQDELLAEEMIKEDVTMLETNEVSAVSDMGADFDDYRKRAKRIGSTVKTRALYKKTLWNFLVTSLLTLMFFYPLSLAVFYLVYAVTWFTRTNDLLIGLTAPFLFILKKYLIILYAFKELLGLN